jgi:hypothetical protein
MKQFQKFINDKERVCDNPECQTIIPVGDYIVKQVRSKYFGGDKYFHERCKPR